MAWDYDVDFRAYSRRAGDAILTVRCVPDGWKWETYLPGGVDGPSGVEPSSTRALEAADTWAAERKAAE